MYHMKKVIKKRQKFVTEKNKTAEIWSLLEQLSENKEEIHHIKIMPLSSLLSSNRSGKKKRNLYVRFFFSSHCSPVTHFFHGDQLIKNLQINYEKKRELSKNLGIYDHMSIIQYLIRTCITKTIFIIFNQASLSQIL